MRHSHFLNGTRQTIGFCDGKQGTDWSRSGTGHDSGGEDTAQERIARPAASLLPTTRVLLPVGISHSVICHHNPWRERRATLTPAFELSDKSPSLLPSETTD
ncbi:hypothetical protein P5V15_006427 [Pogonomyrmex californicus]